MSGETNRDLIGRIFRWYWSRRARRTQDPSKFRQLVLRRQAELDRIARRMEQRLARHPTAEMQGDGAIWSLHPPVLTEQQTPSNWIDPEPGFRPARGLSVFHEGAGGAFTLSQRPNRSKRASRFELFFESYEFRGSYLSLAISVPEDLQRPASGDVLRLSLDCSASRDVKAFIRLNLSSVRRTDVLHDDGLLGRGAVQFTFDMAFAAFEPQPGDQIWLDIIFDRPRMMEFAIHDLKVELLPREAAA